MITLFKKQDSQAHPVTVRCVSQVPLVQDTLQCPAVSLSLSSSIFHAGSFPLLFSPSALQSASGLAGLSAVAPALTFSTGFPWP